jgi:Domain of unknown function (DUF4291)
MRLILEPYVVQKDRLPKKGRYIVAQYDEESVVVYQAYRPAIGLFAAKEGYFGGEFKRDRMSWIKPNFLWMMYRSGWGTKEGQEVTLAVKIKRSAFDEILAEAVPSKFVPELYETEKEWQRNVNRSSVRLQWDPDRHPSGSRLERRAIQLGLRGKFLEHYAQEWIVSIEDISEFVRQQHQYKGGNWEDLLVPRESVYPVADAEVAKRLQLSTEIGNLS